MKYDVHVYREMRLLFEGIEAESPEAAAEIARRKHLPEAVEVDDCEGRNFTAEVVEPGRSTHIDFSAPLPAVKQYAQFERRANGDGPASKGR